MSTLLSMFLIYCLNVPLFLPLSSVILSNVHYNPPLLFVAVRLEACELDEAQIVGHTQSLL